SDTCRFRLTVNGRIAVAHAAASPHAPFLAIAVTPRNIPVTAEPCCRAVIRGEAGQVLSRALRHDIDDAADAAIGCDAREPGRGALEHFDALDVVREDAVVRRDSVKPLKGDLTVIAFVDGEAANVEGIEQTARWVRASHGRIEDQGIRSRRCLLIADELVRVT